MVSATFKVWLSYDFSRMPRVLSDMTEPWLVRTPGPPCTVYPPVLQCSPFGSSSWLVFTELHSEQTQVDTGKRLKGTYMRISNATSLGNRFLSGYSSQWITIASAALNFDIHLLHLARPLFSTLFGKCPRQKVEENVKCYLNSHIFHFLKMADLCGMWSNVWKQLLHIFCSVL